LLLFALSGIPNHFLIQKSSFERGSKFFVVVGDCDTEFAGRARSGKTSEMGTFLNFETLNKHQEHTIKKTIARVFSFT